MNRNTLGGILVAAMLVLGWQTSMAAEAGKSAAADLSRDANASLQAALRERSGGQGARSEARMPFLSFRRSPRPASASAVNTARARCCRRARRSRTTTPRARRSGYRPAPSKYGYALFFMNANALAPARQGRGVRGRCRSDRRRDGRGHGEDADDDDCQGRRLCLHLRPEGADGRTRHPGQQDHQDQSEISRTSSQTPASCDRSRYKKGTR